MSGDERLSGPPDGPGPAGIASAPLWLAAAGGFTAGKLLTEWRLPPREGRREGLAGLAAWSRGARFSVFVLEEDASPWLPDLRALGFDDAGPLPCYSAPARSGWLRRGLAGFLLPGARPPRDVTVASRALSDGDEQALRERLAPDFGVLAACGDGVPPPAAGLHLRRGGRPVASCRWERLPTGLVVRDWIAPPRAPDLTAFLALSVLRLADPSDTVRFETPHRMLARGLLLARFLPCRSGARILVRQHGGRGLPAPGTTDWHLSARTVLRSP